MDIHKPRPIHGWRDLVKEIAVIVLGVSIALGAEQGVEWWHWRGKAAYAEDQIRYELNGNMYFFVERTMVSDCIQKRLDMLETKLLASGDSWTPVPSIGTFGMQAGDVMAVPSRPWTATAWAAAIADTSVTHFNPERMMFYSRIYAIVEVAREQNQKEFDNVPRLNVLLKPVSLSNDKKLELIGVIEAERVLNRYMVIRATRAFNDWKGIGLDLAQARAQVMQQSTTYKNCQAAR